MNIEWSKWNVGGKIIFIAACTAASSIFMNWVELGAVTRNGFSQFTFLFLMLWIYPVYILLENKRINLIAGLFLAISSIVSVLIYIDSKSEIFLLGKTVNISAVGAWVFLFASIGLAIGVITYQPIGFTTEEKIKRRSLSHWSMYFPRG